MSLASKHSMPKGFPFRPTKEEILLFYLQPAIYEEKLPGQVMKEFEIYGENKEPWKIFNKDEKQAFWVFTRLIKKDKRGFQRTAGSGYWQLKLTTNSRVKDERGQLLGFHKQYYYVCNEESSSCHADYGNWVMHEFSLTKFKDYVVCEIRNEDAVGSESETVENFKKRKSKALESDDNDDVMLVRVPGKKTCVENQNQVCAFTMVELNCGETTPSLDNQQNQDPNKLYVTTDGTVADCDYVDGGKEDQGQKKQHKLDGNIDVGFHTDLNAQIGKTNPENQNQMWPLALVQENFDQTSSSLGSQEKQDTNKLNAATGGIIEDLDSLAGSKEYQDQKQPHSLGCSFDDYIYSELPDIEKLEVENQLNALPQCNTMFYSYNGCSFDEDIYSELPDIEKLEVENRLNALPRCNTMLYSYNDFDSESDQAPNFGPETNGLQCDIEHDFEKLVL
ncbi:hypothetical protein CRYUN_Cryun08bG0090300 [Craigia yunnanensis]